MLCMGYCTEFCTTLLLVQYTHLMLSVIRTYYGLINLIKVCEINSLYVMYDIVFIDYL